MAQSRIRVSGGMGPKWISEIVSSAEVKKHVDARSKIAFKSLEQLISTKNPEYKGWFFFGTAKKEGSWGLTRIIWPTNRMSNEAFNSVRNKLRSLQIKEKQR